MGSRVTVSDWLACQVSTSSSVTLLADSVPADSHSQHGVANNKIVLLRFPLLHPLKRDITAARLLPTIFIWRAKKFTSYVRNGIQMRLLLRRHCNGRAAYLCWNSDKKNVTEHCVTRTAKSRTCVSSSELFVICSQIGG